jgi:tetratricopeptide (TPR) repeat protein
LVVLVVCSAPASAQSQQSEGRPDAATAEYNLGDASWVEGRRAEALKHFQQVLNLDPVHIPALVDAAWLLGCAPEETIRNPKLAIVLARRASELTHQHYVFALDVLAAAYAADGAFKLAIQTAESALRLNPRENVAEAIRSRQELYRKGYAFTVLDPH